MTASSVTMLPVITPVKLDATVICGIVFTVNVIWPISDALRIPVPEYRVESGCHWEWALAGICHSGYIATYHL